MSGERYVWHIVLTRAGKPAAKGERLATLVLSPDDVARIGRRTIENAVDADRRRWLTLAVAGGVLGDGDGVQVIRERGFRRSLFPSAAMPGLTATPAIVVPPGPARVGGVT